MEGQGDEDIEEVKGDERNKVDEEEGQRDQTNNPKKK